MKQPIKLYVVPHSHIDIEWYWTVDDLKDMLPELFYNTTIPTLSRDPEMTFAQDQTYLIDMMLKNASQQDREVVKEAVRTGRLEPVGGMYVQPELHEPCGEALVRQIQIGQKWLEENFGRRAECGWHTDSFGQINQMPQLLRQGGFQSYVFMRDVLESDDPASFPTEFLYEGPDGSRIPTHWLKNSYVLCPSGNDETLLKISNVEVTPENEAEELKNVFAAFLDENSLQHKTGAALILWGDDLYGHTHTTAEVKDILIEAARRAGLQLYAEDILFVTPKAFFDAIRPKEDMLPVRRSDFGSPKYRQDLRALFASRIHLKLQNRAAEQALLSLESMSAAAGKCVADSEELWKPVLFSQFHDTIGGSCLDEVYTAAMEKYQTAQETAAARKQALLGNPSEKTFCVYNPTQFVRTDLVQLPVAAPCGVTDDAGDPVASHYKEADGLLEVVVPNIGPYELRTFHLVCAEAENAVPVTVAENDCYRLQIQQTTGDLVGIWDKRQQRELLAGPANVIVVKREKDPDMEGGMCLTGEEFSDAGITAESVQICRTETGTSVTCIKSFLGFRLKKQIRLAGDRIDFTTDILDYPGEDYLILTQFPMNLEAAQSVFETPFGTVEGRTGFHGAQKWAALRQQDQYGALLNRGTCGYWVEGNTLSMALLRGHKNFIYYGINGRDRGIARFADGKTHTELAAERGDHRFTYALCCGQTNVAELAAQALRYNTPLEAWMAEAPAEWQSPVKAVSEAFLVTKLALEENGALCLRGYYLGERAGECCVAFARSPKTVCQVNLLGEKQSDLQPQGSTVTFPVRPYEIVTLNVQF